VMRVKRRIKNGLLAMLAGAFGMGIGGCEDNGTEPEPEPDGPPSVVIEMVHNEGMQQNNLRVPGFAVDDHDLDSLRVLIDDQYHHSETLHGVRDEFAVSVLDAPVGAHRLQLEVFDNAGQKGQTSAPFIVPEPVPIYDARIFIMREDTIVPAVGAEFCLAEMCRTVDAEGKVFLRDFDLRSGYEINFIEGAHPEFVVAIGKSRLDMNIINFMNGDARKGLKPTDTEVHVGLNERRIIYFEEATVPMQEIIDKFNGAGGWNYSFNAPAPSLDLYVSTEYLTLSQEVTDTLIAAVKRGVEWANNNYRIIPYEDPNTYDVQFKGTVRVSPEYEAIWGKIIIDPRPSGNIAGFWYGDGQARFFGIQLLPGMEHDWGLRASAVFAEMITGKVLSGVTDRPPPDYKNTMISYFGRDSTTLDRTWTKLDRQAGLVDILFDQGTYFLPTGHEPTLVPARMEERERGFGISVQKAGGPAAIIRRR